MCILGAMPRTWGGWVWLGTLTLACLPSPSHRWVHGSRTGTASKGAKLRFHEPGVVSTVTTSRIRLGSAGHGMVWSQDPGTERGVQRKQERVGTGNAFRN